MGEIKPHRAVLLVAAVSSQFDESFDWTRSEMEKVWGKLLFASEKFEFTETSYYARTMGENLKKQFLTFETKIDPGELANIKLATNDMESAFKSQNDTDVDRPLNIDPGYLTEAKLILATTKDRDHRIYLQRGIYAEVTLTFRQKSGWESARWTYPDYQREDFQAFFTRCRGWLRDQYRTESHQQA